MSLEYAILGFLQYKPMYGYEMKKQIDNSVSHFWSADQSLIYRTLSSLTIKSLIEVEIVVQDSHPNYKLYHITDAGRKKFNEWLKSPIEKFDIRVSWLIQLFFAGGLSDEKVIELLTCFLQQFENAIECYSKNETNKYITSPRDKFFKDLTLDYGVAVNMAIKDWIKNTIERIKNKEWEKYNEVSHE